MLTIISDANRKHNPACPPAGRNKFEDPESPWLPPAIPSWQAALSDFGHYLANSQLQPTSDEVNPIDLGYLFPEPALLVTAQQEAHRDAYFHTWLKYRAVMIYRVSSQDSNATPMPGKVWRNLLACEFIGGDPGSSSSTSTKSAKMKQLVYSFLQNCITAEGVEYVESNNSTLKWNRRVVDKLNDQEWEEILWELAELNFRFELQALDSRAQAAPCIDLDRQKLILNCFPTSPSLLVADFSKANDGLANEFWEPRSLYIFALKKLMMTWQGKVPAIILAEKVRWRKEEFPDLEDNVARFYVQMFYEYFRRAPIVPRRLSHATSSYRNTEPPTIRVLNPQVNMVYDVSVIPPL